MRILYTNTSSYTDEGKLGLRHTWEIYIHNHTQGKVYTENCIHRGKYAWMGKVRIGKCRQRTWMGYMGKGIFVGLLYIHIITQHIKIHIKLTKYSNNSFLFLSHTCFLPCIPYLTHFLSTVYSFVSIFLFSTYPLIIFICLCYAYCTLYLFLYFYFWHTYCIHMHNLSHFLTHQQGCRVNVLLLHKWTLPTEIKHSLTKLKYRYKVL